MAAGFVSVDLDITDVRRGMEAMKRAARDGRGFLRRQAGLFREEQRQHFEEKKGPFGKWPPRATASINKILSKRGSKTKKGKIRKRAQRKLDDQLGRLKTGLSIDIRDKTMTIRSRVPWSGIHQDGGVAARGVRIPARPFLYVTDRFLKEFAQSYASFVARAWEK